MVWPSAPCEMTTIGLAGVRGHALVEERQRARLDFEQRFAVGQAHAGWRRCPGLAAAGIARPRSRRGSCPVQPPTSISRSRGSGLDLQAVQRRDLAARLHGAAQVAAVDGRDRLVGQRAAELARLRQAALGQRRVGLALPAALDVEHGLAMARQQDANRCSTHPVCEYKPAARGQARSESAARRSVSWPLVQDALVADAAGDLVFVGVVDQGQGEFARGVEQVADLGDGARAVGVRCRPGCASTSVVQRVAIVDQAGGRLRPGGPAASRASTSSGEMRSSASSSARSGGDTPASRSTPSSCVDLPLLRRRKTARCARRGARTVRPRPPCPAAFKPLELAHEQARLGAEARPQLFLGQPAPQRIARREMSQEHRSTWSVSRCQPGRRDDERAAVQTRRAVGVRRAASTSLGLEQARRAPRAPRPTPAPCAAPGSRRRPARARADARARSRRACPGPARRAAAGSRPGAADAAARAARPRVPPPTVMLGDGSRRMNRSPRASATSSCSLTWTQASSPGCSSSRSSSESLPSVSAAPV